MKTTVLLNYPDESNPQFSAGMEMHGGQVEAVHFADLFDRFDKLEEAAIALVDMDPSHPLFGLRLINLQTILSSGGADLVESVDEEEDPRNG